MLKYKLIIYQKEMLGLKSKHLFCFFQSAIKLCIKFGCRIGCLIKSFQKIQRQNLSLFFIQMPQSILTLIYKLMPIPDIFFIRFDIRNSQPFFYLNFSFISLRTFIYLKKILKSIFLPSLYLYLHQSFMDRIENIASRHSIDALFFACISTRF